MTRQLPCSNKSCKGVATLKSPTGKDGRMNYTIGVSPSHFRTPGVPFSYKCSCGQSNVLSKQAFFALPDLDLQKPAPVDDPVIENAETSE